MAFITYKEKILKNPESEKLTFEPDGRNHYVYRVSHIHIKIHYYGSKSEKIGVIEDTIGVKYFTSSKYLKDTFKENREDYNVKIIKRFDNPGDKILFESYLHQKFNVKARYNFINRSNQTPFGFDTTGIKATGRTRKNMREAQLKLKANPKRRERKSKSASEYHHVIANNPEKYAHRSKNISKALATFKEDTDRYNARIKKLSAASLKQWDNLKKDPIKKELLYKKISDSQQRLNNDPIRSLNKSMLISRPVCQYDLDGNFIREFFGHREAAKTLGYKNTTGISACVHGRQKTAFGYIWKDKSKEPGWQN